MSDEEVPFDVVSGGRSDGLTRSARAGIRRARRRLRRGCGIRARCRLRDVRGARVAVCDLRTTSLPHSRSFLLD